ncbi:hypothetical protein QJS10_CPA01g02360 [Acorus calamus]|uniref:Uncharacterized protein n=1 Tax=Acorus calamus TaxID=4465 RepID=A0AAV9FI09_ACOCL|nr:hypothetical protein QJS10_CPA01g02360 [Acorus calamus]
MERRETMEQTISDSLESMSLREEAENAVREEQNNEALIFPFDPYNPPSEDEVNRLMMSFFELARRTSPWVPIIPRTEDEITRTLLASFRRVHQQRLRRLRRRRSRRESPISS